MARHSHHSINAGHEIPDDPELKPSYGEEVPEPSMVKGTFVNFGELAGSTTTATPLVPKRDICFQDSIDDNRKNQPKSH